MINKLAVAMDKRFWIFVKKYMDKLLLKRNSKTERATEMLNTVLKMALQAEYT